MNKPSDLKGLVLDPVTNDQRYIGVSEPRHGARRLLEGQGTYIDDIKLPRMGHVVYWRSPVAHMKIGKIHQEQARKMPGVLMVVDGVEMAKICKPWVATLGHLPGMKSAPQYALAIDRACWQGEPVVAVVAETRAQAEDALQLIEVEWEELPAVVSMESALDPKTPVIHPELGDNLCFTRTLDVGNVDEVFANADVVAEATFGFGRHTGVTLEPRCQIADYNPGDKRLTVYHSQQAPHMMQDLYCRQFGLSESDVHVICKDVGGSFGIKVHAYPDDFATVGLAMMLERPVKFVADRLESFTSDIHAREHRIKGRIAANKAGDILAFEIDDLTAIGPYSMFPRTSAIEGNQVVNLVGGPYKHQHYRAKLDVVFQNKTPTCQYRGVGHPHQRSLCRHEVQESTQGQDGEAALSADHGKSAGSCEHRKPPGRHPLPLYPPEEALVRHARVRHQHHPGHASNHHDSDTVRDRGRGRRLYHYQRLAPFSVCRRATQDPCNFGDADSRFV